MLKKKNEQNYLCITFFLIINLAKSQKYRKSKRESTNPHKPPSKQKTQVQKERSKKLLCPDLLKESATMFSNSRDLANLDKPTNLQGNTNILH